MNKQKIEQWCNDRPAVQLCCDLTLSEMIQSCVNDLAPQWVSVSERLPEDNQQVVMFMEGGSVDSDLDVHTGIYSNKYGFERSRVTHWRLLPAAPEVV